MALFAILAKAAFVAVDVAGVTILEVNADEPGETAPRCGLGAESFGHGGMTLFAVDFQVPAGELKLGAHVFKIGGRFPA